MKEFFLHLWSYFTGVSATFFTDIEPVLKSEVGQLWQQLIPMAVPIVTALIPSSASGSDKLSSAFASLKTAAEGAGIQAAESVLNSAIEIALQIAKANA